MIHKFSRYIMTLVALFAMTAGAWADDYLYLEVDGTSATVKYGADKGTKPYYGDNPMSPDNYGWYVVTDESMPDQVDNYTGKNSLTTVTIDASCQNYTGTTLESFFDFWSGLTTINNLENLNTSEVTSMKRMFVGCSSMTSFDLSGLNTAKVTKMRQMFTSVSVETLDLSSFNTSSVTDMYCMFYNCPNLKNIYVGDGWSTASVTDGTLMFGKCTSLPGFDSGNVTHAMAKLTTDGGYLTYKAPDVDLTLNDDKTEAKMEMPTYDVTIDYELVRDMAIDMPVTVGDGKDGYRIRLKKSEQNPGKFELADMNYEQVMALIKVHDNIENKDLTFGLPGANCTISIYAIDGQGQPTGDAIAFTDLVPGSYVAKAVAGLNSVYDGETALSNVFELYQGYEVEVPAGEYITYYKDENLYVEDDDAQLYTIALVDDDKAVLSRLAIAAANTPLLVKNNSAKTKTFLLIPTFEQADYVTVADEFKGTLTGTTLSLVVGCHNYAFNGLEFVPVKNSIEVGPNKAWLAVMAGTPPSRAITLAFDDDATGIGELKGSRTEELKFYDLNGRKVQSPTRKGIYILNGKKVVVK